MRSYNEIKNEIEQLEKELRYLENNPTKDYNIFQAVDRSDQIREYLLPDLYDALSEAEIEDEEEE